MFLADPYAYLFAALLLLTLPLDWVLSALLAAVFHELCHLLVIYLLGGKIHALRIGIGGAVIDTDVENHFREFLCTLAGPVGSFFLVCLYRHFPKLAICAGVQGIFNLIPIYPLDGGRVLRCWLELLCPKRAANIQKGIENGAALMLSAAAITATVVYSLGIVPLCTAVMLIIRVFRRKRPCKQGENRVQ